MKKNKLNLLFVTVAISILSIKILAQPYDFRLIPNIDSTTFSVPIPFQKIERTNCSTGQSEIIFYKGYQSLIVDQTQSWFSTGTNRYGNDIYNCSDTTQRIVVPFEKLPESMVHSKTKNKLYVISTPNNQDTNFYKFLSVFNINSKQEEASIVIPYLVNIKEEMFFSTDENALYFSALDSNYSWDRGDKFNAVYFSTIANKIVLEKPLSEIGYPNADGYCLYRGRNGKGIVESYFHNFSKDSYFNIYNFETSVKTNFILNHGFAKPQLSGNGKYLLLFEQKLHHLDSSVGYRYLTGVIKIFDINTTQLIRTLDFGGERGVSFFEEYPDKIFLFIPNSNKIEKIIDIDSLVAASQGLKVKLTNSNGTKLPGGSLQYYEGGWKNATDNGDGTFNVDTQLKTVSLRMTYEYGAQTKSNVSVGADTVVFQTVNAAVKLQNSQGSAIDTGRVQYYAGGWRDFGATANGTANKELLPVNYTFRMNYGYASNDKAQSLDTNSTVIFKTINSSVQLKDSQNNLINEQSVVQYYSGGWRQFGLTQSGSASKELLPNNYTFRISYGYASNDKQQNIGVNPVVDFQTVKAVVQLKNSQNQLIDPGVVQYYSGGWRQFGVTTNGSASKELLPNNYTFRMNYGFANFDKQQSISTNPLVEFQTINATVQLKDSKGNFIDQGTVQYYSGGWREFGSIQSGISNKELLPGNYTFRISYAFASKDKLQNVGVNPVVEFQTVNAEVQLRNSMNNLIDQGTVQYYSGGWRDFGATLNGIANKELLANQYTFRMNYEFASIDKTQDLSVNPSVIFQTVKANVELRNSQGNLFDEGIAQYYSGGWRNFGTTTGGIASRELLPNNYTFRMTNEFISNDKSQNIGTNNNIIFNTVQCVIRARNNQNQPINNAAASYYSGGWRTIGSTINGEVIKELLPANLTFRINYAGTQQDKTQNLLTNNIVEFIIGQ